MIIQGSIKGLVVDMSGNPVMEAAVIIDDSSPGQIDTVCLTNKDGEYLIEELKPGPYQISINSPGRVTVSRTVLVQSGQVSILDFLIGY